jgi:PGF-CTERM protein
MFVRACYNTPDFGIGSSCTEIQPDFEVCWKRASDVLNALTAEGTAIVGQMAQVPVQPPVETVGQEAAQQVGTAVGEVATGGQVDDKPSTLTRCVRAIGNFFKGCFGKEHKFIPASPAASPSGTPDTRSPEQKRAEEEYVKRVKARMGIKTAGPEGPEGAPYTPAPVSVLRFEEISGPASCIQQTFEAAPELCPTVSVNTLERVVVAAVVTAQAKPPVIPRVNPVSACVQQCAPVFESSLKAGKSLADAGSEASACAARTCPVVDLEKLKAGLSPQASAAADKYAACVKGGGGDACRRDLLLGLAGTPEAKVYRFEPVAFEIDEGDFVNAAVGEFGYKDLGAGFNWQFRKFSFDAQADGLKNPAFEIPAISVPLGTASPEVGEGSIQVESVLNDISASSIRDVAKSLASEGVVVVTPYRDPEVAKRVAAKGPLALPPEPSAPSRTLSIKDVAFSVDVKLNNLLQPKTSTLTFTVGDAWVAKNGGPKNVIAVREPATGAPQALPAAYLGSSAGVSTFSVATSGFSVFSLAAVEPAAAAPPAKSPGFEALFGLAALGAALVLFRRRSR